MSRFNVFSPRAAQLAVGAVFLALLAVQWRGPGFLPGTDAIAYITGGVNLFTTGSFTNPGGEPELWFPPLYPILIGAASLGGRVDPTTVAHLLSASFALLGLFVTARIAREIGARGYEPALAMALLALNPIHQRAGLYAWSEATATLLALSGFLIWLRLPHRDSYRHYLLVGLCAGLSYLTRPEGLLLLPVWLAVDAFGGRISRPFLARWAIAGVVFALVALPYMIYLYEHTGRLTLTGKTEINLASGRATYFGQLTTSYIDPATLEIGLWREDFTFLDDAGRVAWNSARILATYGRNLGAFLALPVLLGVVALVQTRRVRFLSGGTVFLLYVLVVALFQVKDRFLHLSLPFLSILAARGVIALLEFVRETDRRSWRAYARAALAIGGVGLIVQGTAAARHHVDVERTGAVLFRNAGIALREHAPTHGVIYEQWGHFGFHARQHTRILTRNDVDTILRYIDKHEQPGRPIYLALSSMEAEWYHPSVRALLQSTAQGFPRLRREISLSDERGTVVIYRVQAPADGQ